MDSFKRMAVQTSLDKVTGPKKNPKRRVRKWHVTEIREGVGNEKSGDRWWRWLKRMGLRIMSQNRILKMAKIIQFYARGIFTQ